MSPRVSPEKQREYRERWNALHPGVRAARSKQWAIDNPDRVAAAVRRRRDKERTPAYRLMDRCRRYGITEEMFWEYLDAQEGACAFCGRELPADIFRFAVDHDHQTGAFRGLVHMGCNATIGWAEWDDHFIGYMAEVGREVVA